MTKEWKRKAQGDVFARPVAVLDTNIFLDISSCHDLTRDVDALYPTLGEAVLDEPSIKFRLLRAREALLLAVHLHNTKSTTWSLHREPVALLMKKAPPARGGTSLESDFVSVFAWFTKDYLLRGWNSLVPKTPGRAMGDAADLALIEYAKQHALPVITGEGVTKDGISETKKNNMRKRCRDAGVSVFAPREYVAGKLEPEREIETFLERFRDRAPVYLERRRVRDKMSSVLEWVYGHYRLVLKGEVNGRDVPLDLTAAAKRA